MVQHSKRVTKEEHRDVQSNVQNSEGAAHRPVRKSLSSVTLEHGVWYIFQPTTKP